MFPEPFWWLQAEHHDAAFPVHKAYCGDQIKFLALLAFKTTNSLGGSYQIYFFKLNLKTSKVTLWINVYGSGRQ